MECPKCGLLNVESAIKCDCGYNFKTHKMENKLDNESQKITAKSIKNIYVVGIMGFIFMGIFLIVSAILQSIEGVLNADLNAGQISSNIAFNRVLIGISLILFGNLLWTFIYKGLILLLNKRNI